MPATTPADNAVRPPWHALAIDEVLAELDVDPTHGLDPAEVERRRAADGPNRLTEATATAWWVTLLGQFRSPLIYLLLLAGLLTLALGEHIDAGVIAAVLALNASIGFVQERKAEASVLALMQLVSPHAHVVRNGTDAVIDSVDLVPGDVILLESGVKVPADARLVSVSSLQVDESLLTGESVPVQKQVGAVDERVVIGDRTGVVFSGSTVTSGRGRAVVVATGQHTELGQIAEEVREAEDLESPLQERMRRFAHILGAIIAVSAALTFVLGIALDHEPEEMLLVAAALAVAAIPEGLPVVLTVALALGVRRMAQRNAIVRRLAAVETLGSTTVIGSDKTGTLTENRMIMQALWVDGDHHRLDDLPEDPRAAEPIDVPGLDAGPCLLATLAGTLANEASIEITDDGVDGTGDPTEVAFLVAAARQGLDVRACRSHWAQTAEIPFESEHRYAASFRHLDGNHHVFVKGAPERVLDMCEGLDRDEVLAVAEQMAAQGLRVLATAYAPLEGPPDPSSPPEPAGLRLLGLHGLLDPPRPGVPEAIAACQRAGQRVIMITGDHATTARAIARQVGIVADEDAPVLTGVQLDQLDAEALAERVDEISVFARVSPEHKLRIVRAVRARDNVVAVTGDGVNDAPALKNADIGIAMGQAGTDVAREAADIVLADDNFVSIHAAVEEGRVTFDNVRKVTFFLLSTGVGTFVIVPIAMVLGWPLILVPAQLLWANLVTKGLQDLALAFEPGEPDVLDHPPRRRREPIISRLLWWRTLLVGTVMAVGTLVMFDWALATDASIEEARAVALTTLVVFQAFHLGSSRSELRSIVRIPPFSNRFLVYAQLGALAVHVAALYLPPTQFVLRVEPISGGAWVRLVAVAFTVIIAVELDKLVRRRRAP